SAPPNDSPSPPPSLPPADSPPSLPSIPVGLLCTVGLPPHARSTLEVIRIERARRRPKRDMVNPPKSPSFAQDSRAHAINCHASGSWGERARFMDAVLPKSRQLQR